MNDITERLARLRELLEREKDELIRTDIQAVIDHLTQVKKVNLLLLDLPTLRHVLAIVEAKIKRLDLLPGEADLDLIFAKRRGLVELKVDLLSIIGERTK